MSNGRRILAAAKPSVSILAPGRLMHTKSTGTGLIQCRLSNSRQVTMGCGTPVLLARMTAGSRWSRGAVPGTRWASSLSSQVEMPATGSQRPACPVK